MVKRLASLQMIKSVMLGALGPQPQLWPTRGVKNTAQDISVLDNAFVLIDALSLGISVRDSFADRGAGL
jgi:hypothetical protein